jgi:modulator of FtsH protease
MFSAGVAAAALALRWPAPGMLLTLGGYVGLLFAVYRLKNSAWALPAVFGLTGFMGYTLGPLLSKTLALLAALAAVFLQMPTLALVVSAMVALLSAGLILFETSRIVHGGETNYVLATVGLYVSIFNLFTSLLSLFGLGASDE